MSKESEEYDPDMDKEYDPGSPVSGIIFLTDSPKPKRQRTPRCSETKSKDNNSNSVSKIIKAIPNKSATPEASYSKSFSPTLNLSPNQLSYTPLKKQSSVNNFLANKVKDQDELVLNPIFSPSEATQVSPEFPRHCRSPSSKTKKSSSFLLCVLCKATPLGGPLYGCAEGHIVCASCREKGGVLLSCPHCGDQNIGHRLSVAESLLIKENEKDTLVECRYKDSGCKLTVSRKKLFHHEQVCLFQTVKCPKAMFSSVCSHTGPLCTIQEHGRGRHGLHQGVTEIERGVISSKMFDKSDVESCCSEKINARFQPLELCLAENTVFYCYFERYAVRRLWMFFIRLYGSETSAAKYTATISLGPATLDKQEHNQASVKYAGKVAHYAMSKDEILRSGLVLSVADEVILSFKRENILFRIWFGVKSM